MFWNLGPLLPFALFPGNGNAAAKDSSFGSCNLVHSYVWLIVKFFPCLPLRTRSKRNLCCMIATGCLVYHVLHVLCFFCFHSMRGSEGTQQRAGQAEEGSFAFLCFAFCFFSNFDGRPMQRKTSSIKKRWVYPVCKTTWIVHFYV